MSQSVAEDIYFTEEYCSLYEPAEQGKTVSFQMDCPFGSVFHLFLKRPIPTPVDGVRYYDATTAYGYGGPVIRALKIPRGSTEGSARQMLLHCFEEKYGAFCKEQRIIAEFVRFHPVLGNGQVFAELFSAQHIRDTVGTDLLQYPDFEQAEYSKSCRKNIRRCLRAGVTVEVVRGPEDLEEFIRIYETTMDRNQARQFYYFGRDYFRTCLREFRDHILLVKAMYQGRMIAGAMDFVWGDLVSIHLSGTLPEFLSLSPAYLLRYGVTLWAKEHGCRMVHHGGGRSNDPEDALYRFKKQFGEKTALPFYIGRKVWDPNIYERLCSGRENQNSFPAYRG